MEFCCELLVMLFRYFGGVSSVFRLFFGIKFVYFILVYFIVVYRLGNVIIIMSGSMFVMFCKNKGIWVKV